MAQGLGSAPLALWELSTGSQKAAAVYVPTSNVHMADSPQAFALLFLEGNYFAWGEMEFQRSFKQPCSDG